MHVTSTTQKTHKHAIYKRGGREGCRQTPKKLHHSKRAAPGKNHNILLACGVNTHTYTQNPPKKQVHLALRPVLLYTPDRAVPVALHDSQTADNVLKKNRADNKARTKESGSSQQQLVVYLYPYPLAPRKTPSTPQLSLLIVSYSSTVFTQQCRAQPGRSNIAHTHTPSYKLSAKQKPT